MKTSNFAFTIGYIAALTNKLITKTTLEKLKKCETVNEFFKTIKKYNFKKIEFKNYEEFEKLIEENFNNTISDIKKNYPKAKDFEYIFCKDNFLNFKILLKNKLFNIKNMNFKINSNLLNIEEIEISLKSNNFKNLPKVYEEAFSNIFKKVFNLKDAKEIEILIDKKLYETLLKLSKKDIFLTEITKLEITLKNINFTARTLKYTNNIKYIDLCLIEDGYLEKQQILNYCKNGFLSFLKIFEKFNIKKIDSKIEKSFNNIDYLCENILYNFLKNQNYSFFSFYPVFIFIEKLKKENEILKTILLNIYFKNTANF